MSVKERLIEFVKYKGMSNSEFCRRIGVSNAFISSMVKSIQPDKLKSIALRFPELNTGWLMTGEGDMLKQPITGELFAKFKQKSSIVLTPEMERELQEASRRFSDHGVGVPYYDIDITGGIVESFNDVKEKPDFFVDFKPFNDCAAYMPIFGDSMYPMFASGEILAVKQMHNYDAILWGEPYLVVTNAEWDNLRTVKLVHPHDEQDKIILRASNPNFKGDTVVPKTAIVGLFIVKGKINRRQL